ncbi:hypothetical protein KCP91_16250 [Microvirga sp. SRT01]|uniref:site-specific DNA-methyltransferase (cytosine-N(4)-specific) n=1 Tax=Sphingomonas longa TaxID=2778730 RepID=A0ABS2DAI3_9SPHN|nr:MULTISPECIES: hypothetical protein [Alphaproteobacteria]MBM6577937.1 hypothetical protein [Sphingomonas sp. BT552]MBR7710978.1 hypothetical protein [Microvirga sp. SRT01]
MQQFKTVYFADHASPGGRSGLTVSFSAGDGQLFGAIAHLSSHAIRRAIGHDSFGDLQKAADQAGSTASGYVRDRLRSVVRPLSVNSIGTDTTIQSTFVGGKGSPLHDWFPYLEGYSPAFVRAILHSYAPGATSVIDPFCGSGTTALTAATLGMRAEYCEVNPACRRVIEAKSLAILLPDAERLKIAGSLRRVADDLRARVAAVKPAEDLRAAFLQVFGTRPFFRAPDFEAVLSLRTVVDEIGRENEQLGRLVEVAVLGCLVTNSLMVRRGDLRFRTSTELAIHRTDPVEDAAARARMMASDLLDLDQANGTIKLASADVRDVHVSDGGPFDAVVTSPPYLNGTNYFRNTKIELWFSRYLSTKAELRRFRDAAITSGINDVTNGKVGARVVPQSEELQKTLMALEDDAYDQRIPKMAAAYFAEMDEAFGRLRAVVQRDACVAVDLGDSCYGDVHVRTDTILRALMTRRNFEFEKEVVLRERASRSGRQLRQTLQIFRVI